GPDLPAHRHAESVHPRRPLGARVELDPGAGEPRARGADDMVRDVGGVPGARTPVAPAAVGRRRVVERTLEEGHATAGAFLVLDHQPLLGLTGRRDPRIPL